MRHQVFVQRAVADHLAALRESTRQAPSVPEDHLAFAKKAFDFQERRVRAIANSIADEVSTLRAQRFCPRDQGLPRDQAAHALQGAADG
jgi:hypothetical protein